MSRETFHIYNKTSRKKEKNRTPFSAWSQVRLVTRYYSNSKMDPTFPPRLVSISSSEPGCEDDLQVGEKTQAPLVK
jgi:hypothetical protein